jgi:hypothetical protein
VHHEQASRHRIPALWHRVNERPRDEAAEFHRTHWFLDAVAAAAFRVIRRDFGPVRGGICFHFAVMPLASAQPLPMSFKLEDLPCQRQAIDELCREYGFTKFIILVPSVSIREGVLFTIELFRTQLERLYNIPLHAFEYDSKKLTKVKRFIEGTDLQVMVMTTHSFSADANIINRPDRDDSPDGFSYWQALGKVRPIVIMDEPQ